jgi:hypothetical protein
MSIGLKTKPDIFLKQEDIPPLIQALSTFALEVDRAQDRKHILINAGIPISSLCQFTFNMNALLFANSLVSHFREYRVSACRPTYHPMVNMLEYLLETYAMEEQDIYLFTRLIKLGRDNLETIAARSAVGRIESPAGTAIGTGVLVGSQLLLTCRHIFEHRLLEEGLGQAWIRFGYKVGKYCVEQGELFELDIKSIDDNAPIIDHKLDYALVKINGMPKFRPVGLYDGIPTLSQPIRVIHHPRGEPVQISQIGQIVEVSQGFIQHNAEVDYGSSGAPIFDLHWRVVAIEKGTHSLSRPSSHDITEGVPIFCMWDHIKPYMTHVQAHTHQGSGDQD